MSRKKVHEAPQEQTPTPQNPVEEPKRVQARRYFLPEFGVSVEAESPAQAIQLANQQKGSAQSEN